MELILTHHHADFDGLGAMLAAKHLNPRAQLVLPDALNDNVRRFVAIYRDAFGMIALPEVDWAQVEAVTLVDVQDPARAGVPAAVRERLSWEVVDHHPASDRLPAGARAEIRAVGAATTVMVSRLRRAEVALAIPEATAMLLGIMEDTGRLCYPTTTPEDAEAVAYLFFLGARADQLAEYLEPPLTAEQADLLAALIPHAALAELGGRQVLLIAHRQARGVAGVAAVVERLMALYQPHLALLAFTVDGATQLVARARAGSVDLRRLLAPWPVGGHATAAAGRIEGADDPQALLAQVRERLEREPMHGLLARDLMSRPVRTLSFEDTVSEALEAMRRWGHTAMPVVHRDRVQGVISRRDLDRALHHGFGDHAIKRLVPRFVASVSPEARLEEVRDTMAELDIGRLVVLDGDRLVGIVTRSDLIRQLAAPREAPTAPAAAPDVCARLAAQWPAQWREVIEAVGRAAGDRPAYLIGGAVRDLLLDRPSFDVDVLVEGDAIALGRRLAARLPAHLKAHEAFGTAHLSLPSGKRVDLATARLEHYPHPGALPVVSPGTARQDLSRRDFTINAMGMRLNPDHFGELLDAFGGLSDLAARRLRILHPISFIEDPIRIWRGVRFEIKLGFRLEPNSEASARYVLASGRFDTSASERLKLELRLGFTLPRLEPLFRRLIDLDALRMLHAALRLDPGELKPLRRLDRLRPWLGELDWVVPLAWLTERLDPAQREETLGPMHLSRRERQELEAAWRALALVRADGFAELGPGELAQRMAGLSKAVCGLMMAAAGTARERRQVRRWACQLAAVRLEALDGQWLRARGVAPGPIYRELLEHLLAAKRAGELPRAEDEAARAACWLAERGYPV